MKKKGTKCDLLLHSYKSTHINQLKVCRLNLYAMHVNTMQISKSMQYFMCIHGLLHSSVFSSPFFLSTARTVEVGQQHRANRKYKERAS